MRWHALFWYVFAVVVAFAMEAEPARASPALPPGGLVATRTTAGVVRDRDHRPRGRMALHHQK